MVTMALTVYLAKGAVVVALPSEAPRSVEQRSLPGLLADPVDPAVAEVAVDVVVRAAEAASR